MRIGSAYFGPFAHTGGVVNPLSAGVTVNANRGQQALMSRNQATITPQQQSIARLQDLVNDIRGLQQAPSIQSLAPQQQGFTDFGAPLTYRVPTIERRSRLESAPIVVGVNHAQIASVYADRLPSHPALTIQGEVTRAARAAQLTVRGGDEAVLTAGGTYAFSGSRGEFTLSLTAGESLHDVSERINERTHSTGVRAEVSGSDLQLWSVDVGSSESVRLQAQELDYSTQVGGVNAGQIGSFQIVSLTQGASEILSGELVSTAQSAEIVYRGADGSVVAGTASFQLSGSRGSTIVAIVQGESLAAVAQRINQDTPSTGVVASVSGNDLHLTSDATGSAASVQIDSIQRQYDLAVSGVNPAEVADFNVLSLDDGSEHVLTGEVTRSATSAVVALQGSAGGTVIDTATFELSGSLGAATIAITQGESLSAVADRVNAAADSTGVTASAIGDQLVFTSTGIGSSARTEIELIHVNHTTEVSGVNSQQLANFQVNSISEGSSQTLNGSITQTAGKAELTFTGGLGLIGKTATFTISGSQGSAQISVSALQSLSSLASQVNARTATTGVAAVVQGQQVKFRSVGVGSAATVAINVTSGNFPVTGGNGNGTANGTNAVAVVNGQTITGAGNDFSFSDAVGSYSFTAVSGFTGAISPVSIVSQAGSFALTGGNGDGTAVGLDALATMNGSQLTGNGNRFAFSQPGGQFELEFAAEFTGQFSPISVQSVAQPFDIEGGDGAGLSTGADAVAVINGVEHASADGRFEVQGTHGTYEIEFAPGFIGNFDSISVASVAQQLDVEGGDETGRAVGVDAQAIINGQLLTGVKSLFSYSEGGQQVTLDFQPGFVGEFDPLTVTSQTRTVTESVQSWRLVAGSQTPDAGTSSNGAGGRSADSLNRLLDEVAELTAIAQSSEPAKTNSVPVDARLLAKSEVTRRLLLTLSIEGPLGSYRTTDPPLPGTLGRIRDLINLLA